MRLHAFRGQPPSIAHPTRWAEKRAWRAQTIQIDVESLHVHIFLSRCYIGVALDSIASNTCNRISERVFCWRSVFRQASYLVFHSQMDGIRFRDCRQKKKRSLKRLPEFSIWVQQAL